MKEKTLVVGGSGFIGSALQKVVQEKHLENNFTFSFNKRPEGVSRELKRLHVDLLKAELSEQIKDFTSAIYVAGNADHALAKSNPLSDLNYNVYAFVNFMRKFSGKLVLLSSQAIYYGLEGEVQESIEHTPAMPYGISKKTVEAYAKYFLKKGVLSKLWILRLAYAFGEKEKKNRLIPKCAQAALSQGTVTLYEGGTSFINPLPVSFVADVLVKALVDLETKEEGFIEVTNLNHPCKITVKDVTTFLSTIRHFNTVYGKSEDEWPVLFWGSTLKLSSYLKKWDIDWPDPWVALKEYFINLTKARKING
jgi:nucleoside-diphosphate-sugar epimerase